MDSCMMTNSGECKGPVVADLVVQAKQGRRNVGKARKFPLCVVHALKGSAYSWIAHAGESIVWDVVRFLAPGTRKGLHLTYRIVVREPWKSAMRKLGL